MLPLFSSVLQLFVAALSPAVVEGANCCKAVPGTAQWPSPDAWNRLNVSTGGQLLQPPPPGAPCHQDQPTYNATQCAALQAGLWYTFDFHVNNSISNAVIEFNNDSCIPNATAPCSGAGYPVYVVNATDTRHVKLGVDFGRENNVRLNVKGTGHDYLGRSVAPNSLSIWTHNLVGMTFHQGQFQPQGCEFPVNSSAVTVMAGTTTLELYAFTALYNQTVVGGGARTVGVGGYYTGGGHSVLSSRYGLATDNALEMEVVTPAGDIVTANACQNKDLFWALRGGGGSIFGVITSITTKTHPSPSILYLVWTLTTTDYTNPSIFDVFAYILSQFPSFSDSGVSGYTYTYPASPDPAGGNSTVAYFRGILYVQDTKNATALNGLLQPVSDHINATWPGWTATVSTPNWFPSFYEYFSGHYDTSLAGIDQLVGSRLLDRAALTANLTALAEPWEQFAAGGVATAYLVAGKGVASAVPAGGSDAVNPAWRTAYVHATNGVAWRPRDFAAEAQQTALVNYYTQGLRDLAPNMGAYINEADPYEPDWQATFWGDNYPRLLEIKKAYDPNDVLWCHPCVGGEGWQVVGDRLCRVQY